MCLRRLFLVPEINKKMQLDMNEKILKHLSKGSQKLQKLIEELRQEQ